MDAGLHVDVWYLQTRELSFLSKCIVGMTHFLSWKMAPITEAWPAKGRFTMTLLLFDWDIPGTK